MKEKTKLTEKLVRYLILKFLPGYHLHRDPQKREKTLADFGIYEEKRPKGLVGVDQNRQDGE